MNSSIQITSSYIRYGKLRKLDINQLQFEKELQNFWLPLLEVPALQAAEAKNSEALFQIGADLYQACVACHNVYMKK